jgi:bacterioferritin-associated ferredoxin
LAVTLVDYRKDPEFPTVTIPHEFLRGSIKTQDRVTVLDTQGNDLGLAVVSGVRAIKANDRTVLVKVQAPRAVAKLIAGLRVQDPKVSELAARSYGQVDSDTIICRCERVAAPEIRELIRRGVRDINEIKAVTRACMGACGAKTCTALLHRLFREEGVADSEIVDQVKRPLFMEVPVGILAGIATSEKNE